MSEPIRVAVIVVTHRRRYLVGLRAPGTRFAGLSEFPGGKCEPGESFEDCARRECLEETGLTLDSILPLPLPGAMPEASDWLLKFFLSELSDEQVVPEKCGSFIWLRYPELRLRQFPEANAAILRALENRENPTDGSIGRIN